MRSYKKSNPRIAAQEKAQEKAREYLIIARTARSLNALKIKEK